MIYCALCDFSHPTCLPIKHFQSNINIDKKPLIAVLDLRWGPNTLYALLGFSLKEIMPPRTWHIYNRHTQRSESLDNIPVNKRNKDKISDCGYEKWELSSH